MSEHPAYTLAALTSLGGTIGFMRTRSRPSLIAGVGVGLVYALAGRRIQTGQDYGYEIAALNSLLLLGSSAPRFAKGPVPKGLTGLGLVALAYYGKKVYDFNQ
ncbi:hypothetical protein BDZ90DRAFT_257166 [Jaminaea rosea]|uniref:TMEM14-domain-containing protein n=1 Tax=Jaminaea rosea TaxID=1569628 RepID=A0A316UYJ8_9BASI|nr:hypothetical protein BDZ90DRAFT_257166 [Jaminaea rosea]PWN30064.1 hypothetical protein BDZ90DRAFT_257166 [Jaminaea rosea]